MNASLQLAPGTIVGGEFRVVRPLSAGGMGAVYVAEQASTGKLRALKLMHPQLVANPKLRERFEQEARVGSLIQSDHVVQVIGAGVDPQTGAPWLAMELLEGEDLAALLRRRATVSPAELHEIFRQLCHGLGAAHGVGVVHRDVKPENVYLAKTRSATDPTSVRILDFGIAKVVAEANTMATATLGTPLWMAPEQTDPRAAITPAADVWSLGLIAFAMLTGRPYWKSANDPQGAAMAVLLREMLFEPLVPASARAAELGCVGRLPHGFDAWFARCIVREPRDRFPTARDAFDALGPALGLAAGATASSIHRPQDAASTSAHAPPISMTAPTDVALPSGMTPPSPSSPGSSPGIPSHPSSPGSGAPMTALSPGQAAGYAPPPGAGYAPPPGIFPVSTEAPVMGPSPTALQLAPAPPRGRGKAWIFVAAGLLAGLGVALTGFLALRDKPRRHRDEIDPPAVAATTEPSTADPPATTADPGSRAGGRPRLILPKPSSQPATAPATPTTPAAPPSPQPPVAPAPRPFDVAAAHKSLAERGSMARVHCKGKAGPQAVSATVFFNPGGAVQRTNMDPQIASQPSALCVQMMLNGARVPPFDGDQLQSVQTTVGL